MGYTRHSLAGTCGIPHEGERVYIRVDDPDPSDDGTPGWPARVHWGDGRCWSVSRVLSRNEFGRAFFGNLCVRYEVEIRGKIRLIWWEHGDWFVSRLR